MFHITVTFVSNKSCTAFEISSDKKTSSHGSENILIFSPVKLVFFKYILHPTFVFLSVLSYYVK